MIFPEAQREECRKGPHVVVPEPEEARLRGLLRDFDEMLNRVRDAVRQKRSTDCSKSAVRKCVQIEHLAEKYVAALQLRLQGFSIPKINEALNIRSASRWCSGRMPRLLLNLDPEFRRHLEKPISLPTLVSEELAFILGVFCGRSGVAKRYRGFEIHCRELEIVQKLATDFKHVFAITGSVRIEQYGDIKYHHFRIGSKRLGRYLEQATQNNQTVPLRELSTVHCRRAFLKGFFSICGSAIRPERRKVHVVKSRNRSMLDAVAVILKREGVLATVNGHHRAELLIQDQNDLDRFRELGILSSEADLAALKAICSKRPTRRMFTAKEYRTAMAIAHAHPALSASQLSTLISEQTNGCLVIDKSVLRQWRRTTKPEAQRRLERIQEVESALRTSPMARTLHAEHLQQLEMLREPSEILLILREIAWLQGDEESDFPSAVPTLENYRALFERLDVPFTAAHANGWRQRREIREQAAAIARISHEISATRSPECVLRLLRQRLELTGSDGTTAPSVLPSLSRYRGLFGEQGLPFNDAHECGWDEAINTSALVRPLPTIARGVNNLIHRRWDSADAWISEFQSASGARYWRTFDKLVDGHPVLQRDLIELLASIGLTQATPSTAWLVGLSIAPELQVISQLVCTIREVREELYRLFQSEDWSARSTESAKLKLYRLLPGIRLSWLRQNAGAISKFLAKPFVREESVRVDEATVLEWLDHIPKYRSRLGRLTEIARKAQQAGLDPRWAVARSIAERGN